MKAESTSRSDPGGEERRTSATTNERQHIVDLDFLRELIAAVDESGIDSLEISRGGTRIRVAKTPPQAAPAPSGFSPPLHAAAPAAQPVTPHAIPAGEAAVAAVAAASNLIEVKSPMVGTFYRSPTPDAPSYVEIGSQVTKGQTLCILEAMKLMNELESDVQGIVREICVENAEPVEYGQVLFRIEPAA